MILKMNNESEGPLTGRVRMTMPPDIGYALAPIICKKVSEEHPQLKIDIDLSARVIDLISESFDFAIRASRLLDSSYIAQKMLSIETWIVRKKCQAQAIHSIEELHDLPWLSMRGQTELKLSSKQNGQTVSLPINVRYSASDFEMIYRFVAAGLGVAQMPSLVARRYLDDGLIERILPEWSSPLHPVYLVYPSAHLMPRRTRLVINIVREILHDENKKLHNEIAHRE
jgi:DNA-binding transcriptional LysR family regulator